MKLFYVAGPLNSGALNEVERQANILNSERVQRAILLAGAAAINVLSSNRYMEDLGFSFEQWLEMDEEILSRCDAVVFVEGWQNSKGARREYHFATAKGIPVFTGGMISVHSREFREFVKEER